MIGLALLALAPHALAEYWPYQTFVTEPTFHPPVLDIHKSGQPLGDGLLFFTPANANISDINAKELASGMIMTDEGELVWNGPVIKPTTNLFVQQLDGQSVLSHWNGVGSNVGHGYGKVTIVDERYDTLYEICPKLNFTSPNGIKYPCYADLHESFITEKGTILVTAVNTTQVDLSSVGGPVDGWVYDDWFYEIDIKTNEIIFHWSALEAGVSLGLSKVDRASDNAGNGTVQTNPWDWFHMNAVQRVGDKYLVNSRHCWTTFLIDSHGNIEWQLDGSNGGDFKIPYSDLFKWQHHARAYDVRDNSLQISYFNNENSGWDNGTNPSSGLRLKLDLHSKMVTILQQLEDSNGRIYTDSQGAFWPLDNGNTIVGYGANPVIKEFGPDGKTRMKIQFGELGLVQSYRAYRQEWHAIPSDKPKTAVKSNVVYMSWNGATEVSHWEVFAGKSRHSLHSVGRIPKQGFETSFNLTSSALVVQVAALQGTKLLDKSLIVSGV